MVLQEDGCRSDVTFMVQTCWTPPYVMGNSESDEAETQYKQAHRSEDVEVSKKVCVLDFEVCNEGVTRERTSK